MKRNSSDAVLIELGKWTFQNFTRFHWTIVGAPQQSFQFIIDHFVIFNSNHKNVSSFSFLEVKEHNFNV